MLGESKDFTDFCGCKEAFGEVERNRWKYNCQSPYMATRYESARLAMSGHDSAIEGAGAGGGVGVLEEE